MSVTDNVPHHTADERTRPALVPSTTGVDVLDFDRDDVGTDALAFRQVHPDDRAALQHACTTVTGPGRERFRLQVGPGETYRWFEARLDTSPTDPSRIVAVVVDVDDLVREQVELQAAHAELADSQRFHQAVIAATPDVIHVYDIATQSLTRVLKTDQPLHDFGEETAAVVSGHRVDTLVPTADLAEFRDTLHLAATLPGQHTASLRHRVVATDGVTYWLRRRVGVLDRDARGTATSLVVVSTEITDLVSVEQRLEHAATHDEPTGLANRRKFLAELDLRLADSDDVAIAVVDIGGLKSVNETRGRDAGHAVLTGAVQRVCAAVRRGDLVARLGDSEFGLLVTSETRGEPADSAADPSHDRGRCQPRIETIVGRIEDLLGEPFHAGDVEIGLSVSAGICARRAHDDAESILKAAYAAMDKVRGSGSGGRLVFNRSLEDEVRMQEHIERNLRRALRNDGLEVHYQPIVVPRTGRVASVEALVRLRDEDGRLLPADQVIAVAERCALVTELDDQILVKASRQVASWRLDLRYRTLRLALNRSAKDLNRSGFHDRIMRGLAGSELPSDALTIEITETVFLHLTSARIEEMMRLRDSQVGLAIDDFGTGYASLSQLVSLPISRIKIDRSFTARMLEDPTCAALVTASVGIASDLGLSCVVEGVETVNQLHALPNYNGLLVQGYLYGRPRPQEQGLDVDLAG